MPSSSIEQTKRPRSIWLDIVRGIAVIAMIIYHFSWDLSHFGLITTDVAFASGWRLFARSIAATFLFLSGVSLALATRDGVQMLGLLKRFTLVGAAALMVTFGSWVAFPERYIFFGILHCMAVTGVAALAFYKASVWLTGLVALLCFTLPGAISSPALDSPALVWLGFGTSPPITNDFVPLFPWFGFVMAGFGFAKFNLAKPFFWSNFSDLKRLFSEKASFFCCRTHWLRTIGRWSLPIYLIHQPLLFAAFLGASRFGLFTEMSDTKGFVESCITECRASGVNPELCHQSCSCTGEKLRQLPIWPQILSGALSEEQHGSVAQTGRQCFEDTIKSIEFNRKP